MPRFQTGVWQGGTCSPSPQLLSLLSASHLHCRQALHAVDALGSKCTGNALKKHDLEARTARICLHGRNEDPLVARSDWRHHAEPVTLLDGKLPAHLKIKEWAPFADHLPGHVQSNPNRVGHRLLLASKALTAWLQHHAEPTNLLQAHTASPAL